MFSSNFFIELDRTVFFINLFYKARSKIKFFYLSLESFFRFLFLCNWERGVAWISDTYRKLLNFFQIQKITLFLESNTWEIYKTLDKCIENFNFSTKFKKSWIIFFEIFENFNKFQYFRDCPRNFQDLFLWKSLRVTYYFELIIYSFAANPTKFSIPLLVSCFFFLFVNLKNLHNPADCDDIS